MLINALQTALRRSSTRLRRRDALRQSAGDRVDQPLSCNSSSAVNNARRPGLPIFTGCETLMVLLGNIGIKSLAMTRSTLHW